MSGEIELLSFLAEIVQKHTHSYQSDFAYDRARLTNSLRQYEMENRNFYWMCRPTGTWLVKERDVFLKGTEGHIIWTHYSDTTDPIRAYRLTVTDGEGDAVRGKAFPVKYREQAQRVRQAALPVQTVDLTFTDGRRLTLDYDDFSGHILELAARYGTIERIRYAPESEAELTRTLMLEHRFEKGWQRKPSVKSQSLPSR